SHLTLVPFFSCSTPFRSRSLLSILRPKPAFSNLKIPEAIVYGIKIKIRKPRFYLIQFPPNFGCVQLANAPFMTVMDLRNTGSGAFELFLDLQISLPEWDALIHPLLDHFDRKSLRI